MEEEGNLSPIRWSAGLKTAVLDRNAILWNKIYNSCKMKYCIKCNQKIKVAKKMQQVWYTRSSFWNFGIRIPPNIRLPANIRLGEEEFKTSWKRLVRTSRRGLEDALKTSLEDVLQTCLQDVLENQKCFLGSYWR